MSYFKALVKRGRIVESIHEAKYLVKDYNSKILLSSKNDSDIIFPRSSIKIFQAVPFIISKSHWVSVESVWLLGINANPLNRMYPIAIKLNMKQKLIQTIKDINDEVSAMPNEEYLNPLIIQ